jgi:4-diphosphocytidyl-2-C-methyl-D-erythritol kinase
LVGGLGEKIRKKFDFSEGCFLIVNPRINISTKEAYGRLSKDIWFMKNKDRTNISENLIKALKSGNNFEKYLYNDFEMTVEKKYPVIKEIKQTLLAFGAEGALMSGSGSTVFGYFKSLEKAEIVRKIIQKHYGDFRVVVG